jgi:hypothetical protein
MVGIVMITVPTQGWRHWLVALANARSMTPIFGANHIFADSGKT